VIEMIDYIVEVIEDKKLFNNTAKVIFDTREDTEDRTTWLETRTKSIGGSEIGMIAGLSAYGSALTVFNNKLGLGKKFEGNIYTLYGNRMEPIIRYFIQEDFQKATGIKLTTYEYPFMMIDKEIPCLSANIDGLAKLDKDYVYWENRDTGEIKYIPKDKYIGIEIKTAGEFLKKMWEGDEIPGSYLAQIYQYMGITGLDYFLIIYQMGKEFKFKVIPRSEDDIQVLRQIGKDFWENHILTKIPPEPTGCQKETDDINYQQSLDDDSEVNISANKLAHYQEVSDEIKKLETEKEKIKQEIFLEMGNNKKGTDGLFKISRFEVKRDSIDTKRFKELYPATYESFLKGTTEFVNLRITKCK
jgi:putative phage-type endonuclease